MANNAKQTSATWETIKQVPDELSEKYVEFSPWIFDMFALFDGYAHNLSHSLCSFCYSININS